MSENNGETWQENRKFVLRRLDDLDKWNKTQEHELNKIKIAIATMKGAAMAWGAAAGMIGGYILQRF